jgi:hypothetical protein
MGNQTAAKLMTWHHDSDSNDQLSSFAIGRLPNALGFVTQRAHLNGYE